VKKMLDAEVQKQSDGGPSALLSEIARQRPDVKEDQSRAKAVDGDDIDPREVNAMLEMMQYEMQ
jgi:hypothetical protein